MKLPLLVRDLAESLTFNEAVRKYAWVDLKLRFDRTVLGPGWVVVTTMMWVFTVGFVMTTLFHQSIVAQLPYLTYGVFAWQFISATLLEACGAFGGQKHFIGSIRLPLTFFVNRCVLRNTMVLLILTVIALLMSLAFGTFTIATIPHLAAVVAIYALIAVPVVTVVGTVGARFLDTAPLISIVMNIMLIVTPIFWKKNILPPDHPLTLLNPFVPMIDLYRDLFLDGGPSLGTYMACLALALLAWLVALIVFESAAPRVRNWL